MKSRRFLNPTGLLALGLLSVLSLIAGCDTSPISGNSETSSVAETTGDSTIQVLSSGTLAPLSLVLENGMLIEAPPSTYDPQGLPISYSVETYHGTMTSDRIVRIYPDALGIDILSASGALLYTYRFFPSSAAGVTGISLVTTGLDTARYWHYTTAFHQRLQSGSAEFEFWLSDHAEYLRAGELAASWWETGEVVSGAESDTTWLKIEPALFALAAADTAMWGSDAQLAGHLLVDSTFVAWYSAWSDIPLEENRCGIIGDIATLVSIPTCFCFLVPLCAVLCVPSAGITAACSGAALIEWILSL